LLRNLQNNIENQDFSIKFKEQVLPLIYAIYTTLSEMFCVIQDVFASKIVLETDKVLQARYLTKDVW
jgi:hypothetical protein